MAVMRCPRCGTVAPADFRFCEVDGTPLVADTAAATPNGAPPAPAGGGCPCGQALDDGEGFCSVCGHRILSGQPAPDRAVTVLSPLVAGVTDRGRRHRRNEDALAIAVEPGTDGEETLVLVVCDGVSSSRDADVAAALAARTAAEALGAAARAGAGDYRTALREAIGAAHRAICTDVAPPESGEDPAGTTIVAAVAANDRIDVGWVGDSRAYWIGASGASRLTRDHSWAEEAMAAGMTAAEAYRDPRAHAIIHCLGPLETIDEAAPEPGLAAFAPSDDGWLILCTDGFWNGAPEPADVAGLLAILPPNAEAQARAALLVDHALGRGGLDNITVIAARRSATGGHRDVLDRSVS
jgi:serine/threonine protein phosphatase PrpC